MILTAFSCDGWIKMGTVFFNIDIGHSKNTAEVTAELEAIRGKSVKITITPLEAQ